MQHTHHEMETAITRYVFGCVGSCVNWVQTLCVFSDEFKKAPGLVEASNIDASYSLDAPELLCAGSRFMHTEISSSSLRRGE